MGILSMIGRFWRDVSGSISLGLDLSISHPSGAAVVSGTWLLDGGTWADSGVWDDSDTWQDT